MRDMVVINSAITLAKLQSDHHHQQTNTQLFTGRVPFLSPSQLCPSTERVKVHNSENKVKVK